MSSNTPDGIPHDFTVRARSIVEETIGRRLITPKAGRTQGSTEAVVRAIVGRNNIRSTVRCTGIPQNQVKAIIIAVGDSCALLHQKLARDVRCTSLQCNASMVLEEKSRGSTGGPAWRSSPNSAWAWTSVDMHTHFVPHWMVAPCSRQSAEAFLRALTSCKPQHVQISVKNELFQRGNDLIEVSNAAEEALERLSGSQQDCFGNVRSLRFGQVPEDPALGLVSEGIIRKIRRHSATLALLFTYHNFAAADSATKVTPAMANGITNHPWSVAEMIGHLDNYQSPNQGDFSD